MDSAEFYDHYVERQEAVGVNERHHRILQWLLEAGLRTDHAVLEIGCGIGTLTELVAGALDDHGEITAIDLSPKSIEVARRRLSRFSRVHLIAGDVFELDLGRTFDMVILPDVIEHIPLEAHPALFARVAQWLNPDGCAVLHYPNPHHLAWCREHTPEVLQLIDQPIHADRLLGDVYPSGLYLDFYRTYSIWAREGDYVVAVLRPKAGIAGFTAIPEKPPTIRARVLHHLRAALRRS